MSLRALSAPWDGQEVEAHAASPVSRGAVWPVSLCGRLAELCPSLWVPSRPLSHPSVCRSRWSPRSSVNAQVCMHHSCARGLEVTTRTLTAQLR